MPAQESQLGLARNYKQSVVFSSILPGLDVGPPRLSASFPTYPLENIPHRHCSQAIFYLLASTLSRHIWHIRAITTFSTKRASSEFPKLVPVGFAGCSRDCFPGLRWDSREVPEALPRGFAGIRGLPLIRIPHPRVMLFFAIILPSICRTIRAGYVCCIHSIPLFFGSQVSGLRRLPRRPGGRSRVPKTALSRI